MRRIDIESRGLEFKNLVSGPAPVGRILNYIYISNNSVLKHKNGYRYTSLENNIGYAWTTEFMIGLDLICLGAQVETGCWTLQPTRRGREIFNLLTTNYTPYNEGSNKNDIETVKNQINENNSQLYEKFKEVFVNSVPFQILKEYLLEYGFLYDNRKLFIDNYFETLKDMYDLDHTPYNRNARTTTGENRVPSLLQLCQLFNFLEDDNGQLVFNREAIQNTSIVIEEREFTNSELTEAARIEEEVISEIDFDDLSQRYGIDGNQVKTAVVRNSRLQAMFKHNLMIAQGHKCVMCGIKHKELLIGSHIKAASNSNVYEKADHNNGLLLCCNHDKLFDRYLITFNFIDGQIEISRKLSAEDIEKLNLDREFKLPDELMTNERKNYLMEHNTIFNNEESRV